MKGWCEGYASERMDPDQVRRAGIWINRKLKRGKAFEANKNQNAGRLPG